MGAIQKKAYHLMKSIDKFSGKGSGQWASRQGKRQKGTRQKKSKVESSGSPEQTWEGRHQTSLASLQGHKY